MKTLAEIRKRAWFEMASNRTITVYDFADGREVNRHRPIPMTPFDKLTEAINNMRDVVGGMLFKGLHESIVAAAEKFKKFGEAMSVNLDEDWKFRFGTEMEPPRCAICGRPQTYICGEWFCRFC